jgi:mRNA interferase MazF
MDKKAPSVYQHISKGIGDLPQDTIALIDQLRAIDVNRVKAYLCSLEAKIFNSIRTSLFELFYFANGS